jgi:hypothetical protein
LHPRALAPSKTRPSRCGEGVAKGYREATQSHLIDREVVLRDSLSASQATSLAGALVQTDAAFHELEAVQDKAGAAIQRLLYSIGHAIEGQLGGKRP